MNNTRKSSKSNKSIKALVVAMLMGLSVALSACDGDVVGTVNQIYKNTAPNAPTTNLLDIKP